MKPFPNKIGATVCSLFVGVKLFVSLPHKISWQRNARNASCECKAACGSLATVTDDCLRCVTSGYHNIPPKPQNTTARPSPLIEQRHKCTCVRRFSRNWCFHGVPKGFQPELLLMFTMSGLNSTESCWSTLRSISYPVCLCWITFVSEHTCVCNSLALSPSRRQKHKGIEEHAGIV